MNGLRDYLSKYWLVIIFVFLFVSGCVFSGSESKIDLFSEINEQKIGYQFETIEPIKIDPTENVVNTPSPVQPVQTMTPEDMDNEIKFSSDSFMNGKIVFQWVSRRRSQSDTSKKLLLIDRNHVFHYLGDFAGSPAVSPDGNKLGIGCPNLYPETEVTEICILDIGTITNNISQYPDDYSYLSNDAMTERLTLPEKCWPYQYDHQEYFTSYTGILSLSWSPEADRLALVCGDHQTTEVCILSMDDETICWDPMVSEDVYRISWSPTDENVLAISGKPKNFSEIYLTDPDGANKKYLASGWSPEWSPDGSRIAYVEWNPESTEYFEGIAVINPDGSGHEFLYQYDPDKIETYIYLDQNGVADQTEAIRLAWSPDGRYIAFTANGFRLVSRLFRLDIETGEIISLTDPFLFDHWVSEADWGS